MPAQANAIFVLSAKTFRELTMSEPVTIHEIQLAVIEFLKGRSDVVLHGALAVNVYLNEDDARVTGDADILATQPAPLAEELRQHLADKWHIALRIGERADGHLYRIYQVRKPPRTNRHLVDIWRAEKLPASKRIKGVPVVTIAELIARKVMSYYGRDRSNHPKAGTDRRDISYLLLEYPELKREHGPVEDHLKKLRASPEVMETWRQFVLRAISPAGEG